MNPTLIAICCSVCAATSLFAETLPIAPGVLDLRGSTNARADLIAALARKDLRMVLLPEGIIEITGPFPINWSVIGQGSDRTVLRVKVGREKSSKTDAAIALSVLKDGSLQDLAVEVTNGNSKDIGINLEGGATLKNITVADLGSACGYGIYIEAPDKPKEDAPYSRVWLSDVRVTKFDVAINASGNSTLLVAAKLTSIGSRQKTLSFKGAAGAIRDFNSESIESNIVLSCGAVVSISEANVHASKVPASSSALLLEASSISVSNLTRSGYSSLATGAPSESSVAHWSSIPSLGGRPPGPTEGSKLPPSSLRVTEEWRDGTANGPTEETLLSWGKPTIVKNWVPAIQRALDEGASFVFLPSDKTHALLGTLKIRAATKTIDFLHGRLQETQHGCGEKAAATIEIEDGKEPLEIKNLDMDFANVTIRHKAARTLILENLSGFSYEAVPGAGDVTFVNCSMETVALTKRQTCSAWNLNLTGHRSTLVENAGATLWALGVCSSRWGSIVNASSDGQTTIDGGLFLSRSWRPKEPMFIVGENTYLSVFAAELANSPIAYDTIVSDLWKKALITSSQCPSRASLPSTANPPRSSVINLTLEAQK